MVRLAGTVIGGIIAFLVARQNRDNRDAEIRRAIADQLRERRADDRAADLIAHLNLIAANTAGIEANRVQIDLIVAGLAAQSKAPAPPGPADTVTGP